MAVCGDGNRAVRMPYLKEVGTRGLSPGIAGISPSSHRASYMRCWSWQEAGWQVKAEFRDTAFMMSSLIMRVRVGTFRDSLVNHLSFAPSAHSPLNSLDHQDNLNGIIALVCVQWPTKMNRYLLI